MRVPGTVRKGPSRKRSGTGTAYRRGETSFGGLVVGGVIFAILFCGEDREGGNTGTVAQRQRSKAAI